MMPRDQCEFRELAANEGRWRFFQNIWIGTFVLLTACCLSTFQLYAQESSDAAVEKYLAGLGLVDLQMRQLNDMIDRSPTKRTERAKRLVNLYVDELVVDTDDEERRAQMHAEIEQLLRKVPGARTALLEVMLCVAQQQKAEANAERWLNDPKDQTSYQAARETLRTVIPDLQKHKRSLEADLKRLDDQIGGLEEGKLLREKEKEWDRKQAVVSRADFFLGFSHYYAGITSTGSSARSSYQKARAVFREFLGLQEDGSLQGRDAESLGLDDRISALALMGMGQCEILLGDLVDAGNCFKIFDDPLVSDADRINATFRHGRTLMVARQFSRALVFSQGIFSQGKFPKDRQLRLCYNMVLFGVAYPEITDAEKMVHVGLREIAVLGRYDVLEFLLDKHDIDVDQLGGFYFSWIKGRLLLREAEKVKTKAAYQAAVEPLQVALRDPAAKRDPSSASRCRYQLALCKYFLKEYEESASLFELASSGFKESGDKDASNAIWNSIASYLKILNANPNHAPKTIALLESFKSDFPKDARTGEVDLLINKIQRNALSRMDAVAKLEKIAAGDKTYVSARYDICQLLHEQWLRDRSKKDVGVAIATQLTAAVDTYLKAVGQKVSKERLNCLLWAVEVHLSSTSNTAEAARPYLGQAFAVSKNLPADTVSAELISGMHYHALRLAQKTNKSSDAEVEARWLTSNAPGSRYEIAAVIHLCQILEKITKKNVQQRGEAYEFYGRLATHYGRAQDDLRASKNARIVNSKLAQYAFETGAFGEAADILTVFVSLEPKNEGYLRRLGLANFEAKRYAQALEQWRTLVSGLERGSKPWHEARYYQIASLAKTDRSTAKKVYQQFEVFYPSPPSPWKRKYFELGL